MANFSFKFFYFYQSQIIQIVNQSLNHHSSLQSCYTPTLTSNQVLN
ncbi:Uncharacterized protein APZ42_026956 [Daphnia magna]|uniref:Uncharacterized protein n=1 Tax=Daphnia magna TaxID=35525 RepID=A0A164RTI8_9CRUS|nr:Uncharacterized protein APZ42_026956 [Daphnia magna]